MEKTKKTIKARLQKECLVCGKEFKLIHYTDKTYRGGKYFGKIPVSIKKERKRVYALGTRKVVIDGFEMNVLKEDPKPYKHVEYWECSKCD